MQKLRLSFLFLILLVTACGTAPRNKQFDPSKVAFMAEANPLFDNQLYPSIVLALNNTSSLSSQSTLPTDAVAQLFPFQVTLTSPHDNAVLRVVIDSSNLNYVTILQEILPRRGETYTFTPSVKWKYDQLRHLRQPRSLDLTFTCFIDDEEVDIKNLHLSVRTVNECPLSFRGEGNHIVDTRWLFAAYVNEDHPQIPNIVSDILDQGIVSRLSGYQSSARNAVSDQVFAVWYYTLNRGISYASISCTSNPSPRANVQHIRFFDEVYSSRQANCIDACVFLASILRKIGLRPVIFVEPCHAYLGYYTDKKRSNIALLETTITAWVNFPDLQRSLQPDGTLPQSQLDNVSKYLTSKQLQDYENGRLDFEGLKKAVARSLFEKASVYNRETYEANRKHFADSAAITYQQLDIESLRALVQPIN